MLVGIRLVELLPLPKVHRLVHLVGRLAPDLLLDHALARLLQKLTLGLYLFSKVHALVQLVDRQACLQQLDLLPMRRGRQRLVAVALGLA